MLMSTPGAIRRDVRDWVLSQEGDRWPVKFDVRDTTFRDGLRL